MEDRLDEILVDEKFEDLKSLLIIECDTNRRGSYGEHHVSVMEEVVRLALYTKDEAQAIHTIFGSELLQTFFSKCFPAWVPGHIRRHKEVAPEEFLAFVSEKLLPLYLAEARDQEELLVIAPPLAVACTQSSRFEIIRDLGLCDGRRYELIMWDSGYYDGRRPRAAEEGCIVREIGNAAALNFLLTKFPVEALVPYCCPTPEVLRAALAAGAEPALFLYHLMDHSKGLLLQTLLTLVEFVGVAKMRSVLDTRMIYRLMRFSVGGRDPSRRLTLGQQDAGFLNLCRISALLVDSGVGFPGGNRLFDSCFCDSPRIALVAGVALSFGLLSSCPPMFERFFRMRTIRNYCLFSKQTFRYLSSPIKHHVVLILLVFKRICPHFPGDLRYRILFDIMYREVLADSHFLKPMDHYYRVEGNRHGHSDEFPSYHALGYKDLREMAEDDQMDLKRYLQNHCLDRGCCLPRLSVREQVLSWVRDDLRHRYASSIVHLL